MLKYCEVYKNDPNIKELLDEIEPVQVIFDNLKIVKGETKTSRDKSGKLIISGGDRIMITKEQFNELKKATGEIRNIITLNTNK